MGRFRNKKKGSPAIPTAALPDIIFILLFFFMVTTKMRENNPQVKTKLPDETQLKKLDDKKEKITILIGPPKNTAKYGTEPVIQFNERIITLNQLPYYLKKKMDESGKSADNILVFMKVDGDIKMGIVNDVKHVLRDRGVRNIDFSAFKKSDSN